MKKFPGQFGCGKFAGFEPESIGAAKILAQVGARCGEKDARPVSRGFDGGSDACGTAADDNDIHLVGDRQITWRFHDFFGDDRWAGHQEAAGADKDVQKAKIHDRYLV